MKLEFSNTPEPESFNASLLQHDIPAFITYEPNFAVIEETAARYAQYKNVLLIGNGGSLNSFFAYYNTFENIATKKAYFLNTVDPDFIFELRQKLSPEDTVVVAATKSGENTTQTEATLQFLDYPIVFVTGKGSPVDILASTLNKEVIEHPPIGGRYAGMTEVALLPAALCGFDIHALFKGARDLYQKYTVDNSAWQVASILWQLEQSGITDVFVPFYSKYLSSFSQLCVQLCHESFGKDGKGQTYIGFEGPEWQHHSTQRFYGGIQNRAGLFVSLEKFNAEAVTHVPESIQDIAVRGNVLGALDGIELSSSLRFEIEGNLEDAASKQIPVVHVQLFDRSATEVGYFTAFLQMHAVYASLLRSVNPFDQPQVEASKTLSFKKRLEIKGQ